MSSDSPPSVLLTLAFRHRGAAPGVLGLLIAVEALTQTSSTAEEVTGGALLLILGVLLRLFSIRALGRGARVSVPHASGGLIDFGPYAWSRNPLYLAAAFICWGLALLAGAGALSVLYFVLTIALYTPVVIAEEHALSGLIGEPYRDYLTRVSRWVGRPCSALPVPAAPWRETLRREAGFVPGVAAAAASVLLTRSGVLPLRLFEGLVPLGVWALSIGVLILLIQAWTTERRFRKHQLRRAAQVTAPSPVADLGGASAETSPSPVGVS